MSTQVTVPNGSPRRGRARLEDVADPVRHNRAVLSPATLAPSAAPSLLELERAAGLRFVLRTQNRPRPETVTGRIWAEHGLVADVEPLFRRIDAGRTPGDGGRRYLLRLPGLSSRDIALNPFEVAYMLAATPGLDLESVEPDLPHSIYAGNVATEALSFGGVLGCEVDEDETLDLAWHLERARVSDAWSLAPPAGGSRFGEGIVVGHPDTGWVVHDELDASALDTSRSWDFVDGDADATDPLSKPWLSIGVLGQPGHGLGTGSVIVSRQAAKLIGVAPGATLVPIRTVTRVWQIFSGDLARGIEHAAISGCHVISMSLGGVPSEALERAVNDAVARDVIVCAAAGNCVHVVVAPGLYPNAVCVAASNHVDKRWRGSSRGPAVDVTAPGENVWVARRRRGETGTARIGLSQGTSPANATVAGMAALWLAFHGRDKLLARYRGSPPLQHVFLHLLRETVRAVPGWDTKTMGPGIADARALLEAPLPTRAEVKADLPRDPLAMLSTEEVVARMIGEPDPAPIRARLALDLGVAADVDPAERFRSELVHILASSRAACLAFRASLRADAAVPPPFARSADELARVASPTLRAQLRDTDA
jgi:hypothetical protein